jgi:hypothetical protein
VRRLGLALIGLLVVLVGGGKTVKTNGRGTAVLGNGSPHTAVSVTVSGYAPASGATA